MKKIVLFLVVIFSLVFINEIKAQEETDHMTLRTVQRNSVGEYRTFEPGDYVWENTNIITIGYARLYPSFFKEAIANPGDSVLVSKVEVIIKLKPIFKKLVKVEQSFIVFNDLNNTISFVQSSPREEVRHSYLILFSIMLIFSMGISNALFNKGFVNTSIAMALFVFFGLIFIIVPTIFFSPFVASVAIIAAVAALYWGLVLPKKKKTVFIIFYVSMVTHMILSFV